MTLACTRCEQTKPRDAFSPMPTARRRGGRQYWCKACCAKYHREKQAKDPNYYRNGNLKKLYGITVEEWDALFVAQGGVCAVCKVPHKRIVVDHDHATGKVRGLLCDNCNHALGHADDDPARLRAMIDYLKRT